jgi:hypothetical protein
MPPSVYLIAWVGQAAGQCRRLPGDLVGLVLRNAHGTMHLMLLGILLQCRLAGTCAVSRQFSHARSARKKTLGDRQTRVTRQNAWERMYIKICGFR